MSLPASVAGRDRIRLFCALSLPEETLEALERWQHEALPGQGRIAPRDHLHVTLAFLGARPVAELAAIAGALQAVAAAVVQPIELALRRYRETRSVGMLVFDDAGGRATGLAEDLHGRLEMLGVYERERRPWLPHLTVLRFRVPPRLSPDLPDLAPFSPSGAAVYHSLLRPGGAQYEILERVGLGG